MRTLKTVIIEPVFLDGFMIPFEEMEEAKIYISEQYGVSIHKCLCGCGGKTVLPIDPIHGWNLIKNSNKSVSFTPSVGNFQMHCKSHYIITNNKANFV